MREQDWVSLALIGQVGVTIVAPLVLGLLLGLWIDAHFGTRPWATLVLSLAGIGAGTVGVYRLIAASFDAIERHANEQRAQRAKEQGTQGADTQGAIEQRRTQRRDNERED